MIDQNIKSHFNNVIDAEKKEADSYFSYMRHLSTISIGFLGLLVGLKPETLPNCNSKFFFIITIILLSLGILFLSICLFYETIQNRKEILIRKKQLEEYLEAEKKESIQIDYAPKNNLKYFEVLTFLFLALAIISLIFYVYFSTI
jgi:hypothetical protein